MNIELSEATWFKSSHSNSGGDCIEAAHLNGGSVGVRDSKLGAASPVFVFEPAMWDAFNTAVRAGKFDQS
ncbi:DUF397 domain-containing protein [Nocardia sp. SYP-A9097]|uniref:DUF397 domain-containing protein n=1 Tax=Nocardia sp. SYP-A9097 TaxID=2663237 RepID=UPI001328FB0F|nr:DUF397 domain-containing protein [Nocardia sp. SYP-A9097]MRH92001.1 DUF397 domain-containing protein [Nocardia sp. SYP-A9097]